MVCVQIFDCSWAYYIIQETTLTRTIFVLRQIASNKQVRPPAGARGTPNLPTNIVGFRGLDSSTIWILRGGNSHVRWMLQGVSRNVWLKDS